MSASGEKRTVEQPDGTVAPAEGYEWCPHCDGQGEVATMDSGPHLDEHITECGFCVDGIIRSPASDRTAS